MSINAHGPSGPSHGSKIISLERRGSLLDSHWLDIGQLKAITKKSIIASTSCSGSVIGGAEIWVFGLCYESWLRVSACVSQCYESRQQFLAQPEAFYIYRLWQPEPLCRSSVFIHTHTWLSYEKNVTKEKFLDAKNK